MASLTDGAVRPARTEEEHRPTRQMEIQASHLAGCLLFDVLDN